jgi:cell division septal protein FtsQ
VSRHWPDTIVVSVSEYSATAFVRTADGLVALFGPDGRVLEYEDAPPPETVEIVGAREVPDVGEIFFPPGVGALMVEIPSELRTRVATIDVSDGVTLRLGRGEVRLCDATDLARKGRVALALLDQLESFSVIDVCVPGALTSR